VEVIRKAPGQTWTADRHYASRPMVPYLSTEEVIIEVVSGLLCAGMRMHVHEPRNEPPTIDDRLGRGDGILRDLVAVDEENAFDFVG
jgi:hypothetical protein